MTLLRKLAGETAIYGLGSILSRVLNYILFTWYLTRAFNDDTTQFGIYKELYFFMALFLIVLTFRMETTYFRFAKESRASVFSMSMAFLTAFAGAFVGIVWIFKVQIASVMDYPGMTTHLVMIAWVLFFDVMMSVPFASLRQQNRPFLFLALRLGSILINLAFVLFFLELLPGLAQSGGFWERIYITGDKLFYVFLGNLLASAITFFLLIPLMRKQDLKWDFSFLNRMLSYAWPLVIVGIAGVINQSSSITFQKYLLPNSLDQNLSEGGIFAAAASLAILLNLFTVAFNYAAEPFFFAHKDREDARQVYADVALAFTIVGAVMMLCILAYIDLVQLLLGKNFREGLRVVPILLVAYLLLGIYYNFSTWYKLADKTIFGALIAGIGAVLTIVLNFLFIKKYGVVGSAWAALICYLFMCVASYMQGQKYFPIPYRIFRMTAWIVGALLVFMIMEWLRQFYEGKIAVVLFANTILVLAYVGCIFIFEKSLVKQARGKSVKSL
ncbi:MAG TPA: polysaccharide biosynthesis C-terminal domain-containing protein [Saprospiraceae bacterium]|nr:polysaccharide biosynthesis C-terminal domain-containing protein [Saprospiraceae bacterium]